MCFFRRCLRYLSKYMFFQCMVASSLGLCCVFLLLFGFLSL